MGLGLYVTGLSFFRICMQPVKLSQTTITNEISWQILTWRRSSNPSNTLNLVTIHPLTRSNENNCCCFSIQILQPNETGRNSNRNHKNLFINYAGTNSMQSAWSQNKSQHKLIGNLLIFPINSNKKDYEIWCCLLTLTALRMRSKMREKKWDKSNRWCSNRTQICTEFMTSGENKRTCPQYEIKRLSPTANQNQQQQGSACLKPDAPICCNVLRMVEVSWIDFRGQQYVVQSNSSTSYTENRYQFHFHSKSFKSWCLCKNCTFSCIFLSIFFCKKIFLLL